MIVLGYSGLDGYIKYKNAHISGLSEIEKCVGQGMDSAAAIIKDGEIICACSEERFSGKKHTGDFPINAIKTCLREADVSIEDVDFIAHNFDYEPYKELYELHTYTDELYKSVLSRGSQIRLFEKYFNVDISNKLICVPHHDCHAAYAYHTSGFNDKTLILISDGLAEIDSISIYVAQDGAIQKICSYDASASIGMLYSAVTEFLGFYPNSDEYKVMGLAAFGNAKRFKKQMDKIALLNDGRPFISHLFPDSSSSLYDRETYRYFKKHLSDSLFPERHPSEEIQQIHMDLAASLQLKTNEIMCTLVDYWHRQTGAKNLCLSGGVALNCVANTHIASKGIFEKIYIPPASADDGTALGACIDTFIKNAGKPLSDKHRPGMPFYGPAISFSGTAPDYIQVSELPEKELIDKAASDLVNGKIVAWARGRMEFGPRALGHRSILADPRKRETRDRLNKITKERELFRPFAPMTKIESANTFFDINNSCNYKHMLMNASVRNKYTDKLCAVVHKDGTSRVQAVDKNDLPDIWALLDNVEKKIGLPVLLNTSFNLKNKPIVLSEKEAIDSFINSDIDCMVINNYYFEKKK